MEIKDIKFDCRHFRGGIPCLPNKQRGQICPTCNEYAPIRKSILIIKLGALGDVIRTTPLVTRFRAEYPGCKITWLTLSPAILPKNKIDEILPFDFSSVYGVMHRKFDIAINLDKETEACSLLADVQAEKKYGFILRDGIIATATPNANHKLITGAFDSISQKNTKNYLEEIFEICHLDFRNEEYLLEVNPTLAEKWKTLKSKANGKTIVGLNTGCGNRWTTRLWPESHWIKLIHALEKQGYFPMVLGGKDEDVQNKKFAELTGVYYPSTFSLEEFIALTSNCDILVSAVSMMMHIAVALRKPLVLFNNIFNKNEFYLYGRGEIVEPDSGCDDFYGTSCTRAVHCMHQLDPDKVLKAIQAHSPIQSKV